MGSSRKRSRRGRSSESLFTFSNVLLVLATLGVVGLVTYLVLYPPGVMDPANQESAIPVAVTSETPVPTPPPPPPPPVLLTLESGCGAVNPLLADADEVAALASNDIESLDSEMINNVTRELQMLSDISPQELNDLIDPLTQVLVDLNNALLAGDETPELDSVGALATTDEIRALCEQEG